MSTELIQLLTSALGPFSVFVLIVIYLLLRRNGKKAEPPISALEMNRRFDGIASDILELSTRVVKNNDYFMRHIQNASIHHPHEAGVNDD